MTARFPAAIFVDSTRTLPVRSPTLRIHAGSVAHDFEWCQAARAVLDDLARFYGQPGTAERDTP